MMFLQIGQVPVYNIKHRWIQRRTAGKGNHTRSKTKQLYSSLCRFPTLGCPDLVLRVVLKTLS